MTPKPTTEGDTHSDEELMAMLQAGQDAALSGLMERWELGVKCFLLRLGVPASDVEDLAQETFVRLYETRARFRAGAPFKPWLLTLAGNLGRNRLRWRLRRREDSIEALAEQRPDGFQPADPSAENGRQVVEQKLLRQAVRAAVAALPNKLKEAIVCVDLEEMSHAEAGQVMGCSAKAVETRVHRARRRLRELLGRADAGI